MVLIGLCLDQRRSCRPTRLVRSPPATVPQRRSPCCFRRRDCRDRARCVVVAPCDVAPPLPRQRCCQATRRVAAAPGDGAGTAARRVGRSPATVPLNRRIGSAPTHGSERAGNLVRCCEVQVPPVPGLQPPPPAIVAPARPRRHRVGLEAQIIFGFSHRRSNRPPAAQ